MNKIKAFLKKKGRTRALLFIFGLLLLTLGSRYLGWDLFDQKNITLLREMAVQRPLLAVVLYLVATIIGSLILALPGVSFAVVAAIIFGAWWGTLLCTIAATLGALGSFFAGRYFLKDAIEPMIRKNRHLEKLLLSGAEKNAMYLLMVTRLLPIFPYNLQNFAYGVTDIKALPFAVYSFLFMLPGVAMFTFATAAVTEKVNRSRYFWIAVVLAILVSMVSYGIKQKMQREENNGL